MSVQLYSHSKADLEKAVEIILKKATEFTLPTNKAEEQPEDLISQIRSEERRVGKECASMCRSRWSPYH